MICDRWNQPDVVANPWLTPTLTLVIDRLCSHGWLHREYNVSDWVLMHCDVPYAATNVTR